MIVYIVEVISFSLSRGLVVTLSCFSSLLKRFQKALEAQESNMEVKKVVFLVEMAINLPDVLRHFNSFGAKVQTTFVACVFILTNYRLGRRLHVYVKLED